MRWRSCFYSGLQSPEGLVFQRLEDRLWAYSPGCWGLSKGPHSKLSWLTQNLTTTFFSPALKTVFQALHWKFPCEETQAQGG